VAFIDRQVNQTTGTLQVVGLFPNPDSVLRPGQYARVRAQTRVERGALAVPQRAVSELQGSHQVAVLGPDNRVHIQAITRGAQIGSHWIVSDGLRAGDRVVVEGVQKVREGALVRPKLVENKIVDTRTKTSSVMPDGGQTVASDPPARPSDGGQRH
jgi:membrane fusion protein (multidrug efflux system)